MYHALYVFTLLFIKFFSHLAGITEGYSLLINSYTNNYEICMERYIAIAWSRAGCGDLKGIVREFYNAIRDTSGYHEYRMVPQYAERWSLANYNGTLDNLEGLIFLQDGAAPHFDIIFRECECPIFLKMNGSSWFTRMTG